MATTVVKRDGKKVDFNRKNVEKAIIAANKSVESRLRIDDDKIQKVADFVENEATKQSEIDVEEIQDLVEKGLQNKNCYAVAKSFILYRNERAKERFKRMDIMKRIKEKLDASNVQNQNANLDEHSFGGRKGEAESELLKQMALDYYVSPKFAKNHLNNRIYIHDLDSYVLGCHNCLSVPIDELLANGFNTRQVDIRPASSVNTAMQLLAVIFQLQSLQQFGGVAATHVDWSMVPYVRMSFWKHFKDGLKYVEGLSDEEISDFEKKLKGDEKVNIKDVSITSGKYKAFEKAYKYAMDMTKKEMYQAAEGLYHNLNSLQSRSGNQLPFSSINYGTCTLEEGRMVIRALLEVSIDGVGKLHKTSIFPCGIFQKKKGVNDKGSKNYDLYKLAIKSTSKRLYPNYVNCDWSGDQGYNEDDPRTYPSTMGCRTFSAVDINAPDEAHSHMKDGRGNIAPATIILPTLAMEARKKAQHDQKDDYVVDYFMDILEKAICDCKDELIERFNWICAQNKNSAKFMYENNTFYSYNNELETEGLRGALKHGTLAIGQLGLAEALQILIGCDHTEEKGLELAKRIEEMFANKCAEYKSQYKLNFGAYFTPAENLCFTAFKKFKQKYGEVKNVTYADIPGSDKKDYRQFFTNSMHVPVWKQIDPFNKIDIESQLTKYHKAGCITYVEVDERTQHNLKALEQLVDYAMEKDIPYFALNVSSDTCLSCGFQGQIDNECPVCGAYDTPGHKVIQRLRRVTGYLTNDFETSFNVGKQDEVKHRYKHTQSNIDWKD